MDASSARSAVYSHCLQEADRWPGNGTRHLACRLPEQGARCIQEAVKHQRNIKGTAKLSSRQVRPAEAFKQHGGFEKRGRCAKFALQINQAY